MASAFDTAWLASSTASWTACRRSASSGQLLDAPGLAVLLGPGGQRLGVDRDQRRDERLTVADDEALADQRVRAHPVLEHGGGDVLAAGGHQDLLLAPGDPDEALVVDLADVAGVEPAVGIDGLGGGLRVGPVAGEDLAALEHDLAVVGDPDGGAGQRPADGADLECVGQVDA